MHLILRNLQEYDINYLCALLKNDVNAIAMHENAALQGEYGPRVPCTFITSPSEHKQLCRMFFIYSQSSPADLTTAYWHRNTDGTLSCGMLTQWGTKCPSSYYIYVPQDLSTCSQVVVICRDPHNHAPPAPIKTPLSLVDVLDKLLSNMGWQLADATPHRVMLDSGFI